MNGVNRLGGLLLGLILLAVGLLTVIETVALTVWHRSWPLPVQTWHDHLLTTQWSDRSVLITAIVVGVVGLLILALQVRRIRPTRLVMAWRSREDRWLIRRRTVERQAAAAAKTVRGVDSARVSTIGKTDQWKLAVTTDAGGDIVDPATVEQAVHGQLKRLGAPEDTAVRVRVRHPGRIRNPDPARQASQA